MVNKLHKFRYLFLVFSFLFVQFIPPAQASEYFAPEPLEPQLSSDGNSLSNAAPIGVMVHKPKPSGELRRIPPPVSLLAPPAAASSTFSITYIASGGTDLWGEPCYTFPPEAQAAFNAAGVIWGNLLQSAVPVTIKACWATFTGSVLGYSGGGSAYRNFTGATRTNTWYVESLANALSGSDRDATKFDMHITYNSSFNWYYGTDGNTPSTQMDLLTVVLHEIGHGLSFSGSMSSSSGQGSWGSGSGFPFIWDTFLKDGSGNDIINTAVYGNPSTALGTALTSNDVWFHGTNAMAANGGQRVKIYAPSTWSSGSSLSHLDYTTFNNTADQLMVYAVSNGEAVHDPGVVAMGILKDLGWPTPSATTCTYTIAPTSQTFTSSGGTGSVTVTASATSCAWTASSSLSWVTITSGSGTGSGTATFSVSANTTGATRTGNITVAGQTFAITQSSSATTCTYTISPASQTFTTAGGTGSVAVTASASSCTWSATSSVSWATITSAGGLGSSTVIFSVAANTTGTARTGYLTIAGQTFTITQSATQPVLLMTTNPTSQALFGTIQAAYDAITP